MRKKVGCILILLSMLGGVQVDAVKTTRQATYAELTGYCPCKVCCGPRAKNRTASGIRPSRGMCAAPRHLAFGTKIVVKGLGTYTVQDRGGAIRLKGNTIKIDVFFPTHKEALKFGIKRHKLITIIKEAKPCLVKKNTKN